MRSKEEIEREIERLNPEASKFDTPDETGITDLACGAHDALRWALGLAENTISDYLELD